MRQLKNIVDQLSLFDAGSEISRQRMLEVLPIDHSGLSTPATTQRAEDPEAERKMLWQLVLSLKAEIEQLKKHVMTGASDPADHSGEFSPVPSVTSLVKYPEADLIGIHSVPTSLEEAEKTTIAETLARNGGNKRKTAEDLNISLRTLYRKLQEYEIQ